MQQTPIQNAILITDRDRQELLDLLEWLKTNRPDLVAKARSLPYPEPSICFPVTPLPTPAIASPLSLSTRNRETSKYCSNIQFYQS